MAAYFVESRDDDSRAEVEGKLDLVIQRLQQLEESLKTTGRIESASVDPASTKPEGDEH